MPVLSIVLKNKSEEGPELIRHQNIRIMLFSKKQ